MRRHLTPEELERLVRGRAKRGPELWNAFFHLRVCNHCKRNLALEIPDAAATFLETAFPSLGTATSPWEVEIPPATPREERPAWDDWADVRRRVLAEEDDAPDHYRSLMRHPPERRPLWIRNLDRYRTLGLANLCLHTAKTRYRREPAVALVHARLALTVLDALPETTYGAELLADRKALAWVYLANAQRACGNPFTGVDSLVRAEHWRRRGQGDPWEHAWLTRFRAGFLRSFQRFDAARRSARKASWLFRRLGERNEVAWMVVETARIVGEGEKEESAIELLEGFLTRSAVAKLPCEIRCAALQILVSSYGRIGRTFEARRHLGEAQRLARQLDEPLTAARVRWAEALVLQAEGRTRSAVAAFHEAREVCFDRRHTFDAALVTLDLALLHQDSGNTAPFQHLADELWPVVVWIGLPCGWFGPLAPTASDPEPEAEAPAEDRAS